MSSQYGKAAVKRSLLHFLFGKAFNAGVSLTTLVLLARWLVPADYGLYIALLALQTSLLAISGFGIETTTERYMPEFRMRHSDSELSGFVFTALTARLSSLAVLSLILWVFSQPLTAFVGIGQHSVAFASWIPVVVLTGIFAFVVIMLEAMLHQKQAQLSFTSYGLIKLLLLFWAWRSESLDIHELIRIEMIATAVGVLNGFYFLARRFQLNGLAAGWQITHLHRVRLRRFAFFNYVAQLVFQLFNAELMKLLVTRALGLLESARYGFAYNLADTLQRYLPAMLLLRLIKPIFITRYTQSGDIAQLCAMAKLILKLNLLMLTPAIAFSLVYGDALISKLSNGNFSNTGTLLASVIVLQIFSSHQLALSLIAGTLEKNAMQLYAGALASVAFPAAILLMPMYGLFGAIVAAGIGAMVYNLTAMLYLRAKNIQYTPDVIALAKYLLCGVVLYFQFFTLEAIFPGLFGIILNLVLGPFVLLFSSRVIRIFSGEERAAINSLLPKPIFVF